MEVVCALDKIWLSNSVDNVTHCIDINELNDGARINCEREIIAYRVNYVSERRMKALSPVSYVLIKRHGNRVLADVINSSSRQRALVKIFSSLRIQAATPRKHEERIAWSVSDIVVATVLTVNTPNVIRHESEGLNFISANNCLDLHVCKLWVYALEIGCWAIAIVVNNADDERLVTLASLAHPDSKTDRSTAHLLLRARLLSVRSGNPLSAKMAPPCYPLHIVLVGKDFEKHELLVLHVMILANGIWFF